MEIDEFRDLFEQEGLYYIAIDLDPYEIADDQIRSTVIELQDAYRDLLVMIREDEDDIDELDFDDI